MAKTCDMHIHTNYSDGNMSGVELLEHAKKCGLKKLSITDHDCVDFYLDKEATSALKDFDCIPGCEFVCAYEDCAIEILGYGIDIKKAKKYLDKYGITQNTLEKYRSDNVPKVFEKYGITLDYDPNAVDFTQKNPEVLIKLLDSVKRNPDAVAFLMEENPNLLDSISLFLREGLNNPNSKIFIEPHKVYPTYAKIAKLIKDIGGLSFLAHPYQYKHNMDRVLEGVKGHVDGIECYHFTSKEKEKSDYLKKFCKANGLMISGGSDFHINIAGSERSLLNQLDIPEKYFDAIKEKLLEKHM